MHMMNFMAAAAVYRYPIWTVGLIMAAAAIAAPFVFHIAVSRLVRVDTRRSHNSLTGAVFCIVGTTYAVLLAFVAMLAWQDYGAARVATSREAARLLDAYRATTGLAQPERGALRESFEDYAHAVMDVEWPAQAGGGTSSAGAPYLYRATELAADLHPTDIRGGNLQAALMSAITQLRDARADRIAAAETTIPVVIWFVVIAGGMITLAFTSLLGGWDLKLHLTLAVLLSLSGTLVLLMIVTLNHPFRGDFRISAAPFALGVDEMSAS